MLDVNPRNVSYISRGYKPAAPRLVSNSLRLKTI